MAKTERVIGMYVCMYVCMHACMYVCMYVCASYIYIYKYIYIHIYIYLCVCACRAYMNEKEKNSLRVCVRLGLRGSTCFLAHSLWLCCGLRACASRLQTWMRLKRLHPLEVLDSEYQQDVSHIFRTRSYYALTKLGFFMVLSTRGRKSYGS